MGFLITFLILCRIDTLIKENFEGVWGPYGDNPPTGWTIIDKGSANDGWNENDWHKYFYSSRSSNVARVYYTPLENQREYLITPLIDLSGNVVSCSLYFWHYYQSGWDGTDTGFVLLSLDGGLTWSETLVVYQGSSTSGDVKIDLTPYAGNTNCKIAFLYVGNDDWQWMIDDVLVIKDVKLPNDVGISSVLTDKREYIKGQSMNITVRVRNYGINAQSNVSVRCKIIKKRTGSILFNQVKTVSYLPSDAESTVVFSWVSDSIGEVVIKDSTELSGDEDNSNDAKSDTSYVANIVTPIWEDNFDGNSSLDLWYAVGTGNEWEIGVPLRGPDSSYSKPNCAGTDLDNTYENNSDASFYSPYIDLTSLSSADTCWIYFYYFDSLEANFDYVYLEIDSLDGTGYSVLKSYTGDTTVWVKDSVFIPPSYNGDTVRIRFRIVSDATNIEAGFYVDNIKLYVKPLNDVGISSLLLDKEEYIKGNTVQVSVKVKNYGRNGQTNVPVRCKVYKKRTGSLLFNSLKYISNLPSGAESTKVFSFVLNEIGEIFVKDSVELSVDEYRGNDKKDTLTYSAKVVRPTWFDDFDADSSLDLWYAKGKNNEWEIGVPVRGVSSPYSTPNCVGTDLDGEYGNNQDISFYSPYLDLTSLSVSDSVSVIFFYADSLEPNFDFVYLEIKRKNDPGYSLLKSYTGRNDWIKDSVLIPTSYYGDTIRVRFRLSSNSSVTEAGFYFDDLCFKLNFETPVLKEIEFDEGGDFVLEWSRTDGADYYKVFEAVGSLILEDYADSFSNWNESYFYLTKEFCFSEPFSFWTGEFAETQPKIGGIKRGALSILETKNSYYTDTGGVYVEFTAKWEISSSDKFFLEVSSDNGTTWESIWKPNTLIQNKFKIIRVYADLPPGNKKFRFKFIGDSEDNKGVYIDNIKIYSLSSFIEIANPVDTFYNITGKSDGMYFYRVKAYRNSPYAESEYSNVIYVNVKVASNNPPSISLLSPVTDISADGMFYIKFEAQDIDDRAFVSIFIDSNNTGYNGELFYKNIIERGRDSIRIDVKDVTLNNFYIYVMIHDITDTSYSGYSGLITKTNLVPPLNLAGSGTDTIYNKYIKVIAEDTCVNGSICHISTLEGDTAVTSDDSLNLLFGINYVPWSSDAVIRIDGENYIFNKEGNGVRILPLQRLTGDQGIPTTQPNNPYMPDNSVGFRVGYWYNGVEVYNDLIFATGRFSYHSNYFDQVLVRFKFKNTTNSYKSVGLKIRWDPEIGYTDGAIMKPQGENSFVEIEKRYRNLPEYIILQDSTHFSNAPPDARAAAYIKNWGVATPPDEAIIINWADLAQYRGFVYRIISTDTITDDSGLDLIWYPIILGPGDSVTYSTYYGSVRYDVFNILGTEESYLSIRYSSPYVILRWKFSHNYLKAKIKKKIEGQKDWKIVTEFTDKRNSYHDLPEGTGIHLYMIEFQINGRDKKVLGPVKINIDRLPLSLLLEKNFIIKGSEIPFILLIPEKGDVNIKLMDVCGRVINKRVYKFKSAGLYKVNFEKPSTSGIYFLQADFKGKLFYKNKVLFIR